MPRGGARSGAGRKPDKEKAGVILGMDGTRRVHRAAELPPAVAPEEVSALLEPPGDLAEAAKACWRELAQIAVERCRTLTPAEVPGFRELCVRLANVRALDVKMATLGVASTEALPYLDRRNRAAVLLNASLKDFKLTAFGKPATSDKPKAAVNPWAAVAQK